MQATSSDIIIRNTYTGVVHSLHLQQHIHRTFRHHLHLDKHHNHLGTQQQQQNSSLTLYVAISNDARAADALHSSNFGRECLLYYQARSRGL
ncbi:hypothetical protein LSAT2_014354 [Lamellibrachia satsuma]|nr:hypothetical protein LSAT2_014354 [Lamellibrachia satsuma]